MPEAVIIDAVRTPIGALGGVLASVRPDDLAAHVLKAIVNQTGIDPAMIEEVYLGCANQAGEDNRNVARMATLLAGLPVEVPAVTFNRLCASGLNAINQAARAIRVGEGDVYIAGGVESMSRAPYSVPKAEQPFSFGNLTAWDTALGWRYPNPVMAETYGTESMGETAENIAELYPELTRELQDAFAMESHRRAIAAIDSGASRRRSSRSPSRSARASPRWLHRRAPAAGHGYGVARAIEAGLPQGRQRDGGKLVRAERWGRGGAPDERPPGGAAGLKAVGQDRLIGRGGGGAQADGSRPRSGHAQSPPAGRPIHR
jgi:hypothetical protein